MANGQEDQATPLQSSEAEPSMMHTPVGSVITSIGSSVVSTALVLGINSWPQFVREGPWRFLGICVLVAAVLTVMAARTVAPIRQYSSVAGATLFAVAASLAWLMAVFAGFDRDELESNRPLTIVAWCAAAVILTVAAAKLFRRRVRSNNDSRLQIARETFLAAVSPAPADPEVLARLERIERSHDVLVGRLGMSHRSDWRGPVPLGHLFRAVGWLPQEVPVGTSSGAGH